MKKVSAFLAALSTAATVFFFGPPSVALDSSAILNLNGGHCTAVHIGEGYYVTAEHCTAKPGAMSIGKEGDQAIRVWSHYAYDLALILVEAPSVERDVAPIRCSRPVIGEEIYSVGYPGRFDHVTLWGKISGVGTPADRWRVATPVTLPVSGGSSGGPVYDADGNIIGITTATPVYHGGLSLMTPSWVLCNLMGQSTTFVE